MSKTSPILIIILSYLCLILIGAILFILPFSTPSGYHLSIFDALFLSTSSVTLASLNPLHDDISIFTPFGEFIIILLVQLGGLGLITISIGLLSFLGIKMGIGEMDLAKNYFNLSTSKGLFRIVRFTVLITIIIELIGSIFNYIIFVKYYPPLKAIKFSIYHSISAFNNAGIDFLPGNSLIYFQNNTFLIINTAILIFLGGIGFITIFNLLHHKKLCAHSKIVLSISFFLIILGMLLLKVVEKDNITWLQALFTSISFRTSGFIICPLSVLSTASIIIIMFLMFVGASPSSTGGGIKTTTFYLSLKYLIFFATGKKMVVDGKKITSTTFFKAYVMIVFSIIYITFITFLICFIENDKHNFTYIIFEVISAFSAVGASFGITPHLHIVSKILLIITMLISRIGPITFMSVFNKNANVNIYHKIDYLEENIIIG